MRAGGDIHVEARKRSRPRLEHLHEGSVAQVGTQCSFEVLHQSDVLERPSDGGLIIIGHQHPLGLNRELVIAICWVREFPAMNASIAQTKANATVLQQVLW